MTSGCLPPELISIPISGGVIRCSSFSNFETNQNQINTETKPSRRCRLNLGNLKPIYERELTKLDVHQEKGRWNVSKDGLWRKGCRHK